MKLLGIHHVFVPIADLAATKAFYSDVLGLQVSDAGPRKGNPGLWMILNEQEIHLKTGGEEHHFSLLVEDIDVAVADLRAIGTTVSEPEYRADLGIRQALFRDPSGNLLELRQAGV